MTDITPGDRIKVYFNMRSKNRLFVMGMDEKELGLREDKGYTSRYVIYTLWSGININRVRELVQQYGTGYEHYGKVLKTGDS
jgi:hypothetical protein